MLGLVALLLIAVVASAVYIQIHNGPASAGDKFFFGVSFGGTSVSQAELLIDKIKNYTNLFIVNSWEINGAANETQLNEVCEYAVDAGLNVMVYFNFVYYNYTDYVGKIYNASSWDLVGISPWHVQWLNNATEKYGSNFIGAYLYDEPGGKQIDLGYWDGTPMTGEPPDTYVKVTTYSQAAANYTASLRESGSMQHITNTSTPNAANWKVPVFTSDYALYWFDYMGGYDAVFAELSGTANTNSKIQQIALCRGAATAQNKDWGAIITWTHEKPHYIGDATQLLQDMNMAYEAGATYLIVFNYPYDNASNPYGILTDEHFEAMEQFWQQIQNMPRNTVNTHGERVAFIFPKDYGWGLRSITDNIWGLWPADEKAPVIWDNLNKLTEKYGAQLDIIYEDPQHDTASKYQEVYYWNSTIT